MRKLLSDTLLRDVTPHLSAIVIILSALIIAVVRITKKDIDDAVEQAKKRVGVELGELLEAPLMTEEEMDAAEQQEVADESLGGSLTGFDDHHGGERST